MDFSKWFLKIEKALERYPAEYLRYGAFALLLVLSSIGIFTSFFESEDELEPDPTALYEERPNPKLKDTKGEDVVLEDLYGQVTLLTFWASWCGPCQVELPTLKKLHERFQDQGLNIVAINVDEPDISKDFLQFFWSKMTLPFDFYFDAKGAAMEDFKVELLPANFLLNKKGQVAIEAHGANDWSHPRSIKMIEDLLTQNAQN
jgi:thiol-disulfide isomerase/thioredoxin